MYYCSNTACLPWPEPSGSTSRHPFRSHQWSGLCKLQGHARSPDREPSAGLSGEQYCDSSRPVRSRLCLRHLCETKNVQECKCAADGRLRCDAISVSGWDHVGEIDACGPNDKEILLASSKVTPGLCCEPNIIANYLLQSCDERLQCINAVHLSTLKSQFSVL